MEQGGTIKELGHDECLTRMATQRLGQLGVVVDGVPLVLPMRFAMEGETVVLQTNQGAKVFHAPLNAVSFEVNYVNWDKGEGWSVLIQGIGEDISSALDERSETLRSLTVHSWAPPPADRWLKIIPHKITGRHVRASPSEQ